MEKTILVVKRYKRENCTLDDMRVIYHGKTCLVAKNSKHGGLYLHKDCKIIKGQFAKVAGSIRYPILIANSDVHIEYNGILDINKIDTDQYIKQDIITVTNLTALDELKKSE